MSKGRRQPRPRDLGAGDPQDERIKHSFVLAGAIALVLAGGVMAYSNSFSAPFFFDDLDSIPENPHVRQLWSLSRSLSAPPQTPVAGRPVVGFSLALNYAIGGLDVRGYHAMNLGLHLLSTLFLFGIVGRTLQSPTLRELFGRSGSWIALAIAAIWMTHPLHTEAVTYIIQRTELLVGLFYLLTLYCAIRGWRSPARRIWFSAAVVSCALGMASKEVMVSAPLMALLYDRAFVSGSFGSSLRRHTGLYAGLAATWAILAVLVASGPRSDSIGFGLGVSALDYLRTQAEVLLWYLRLSLWPDPLVISYEWEPVHSFSGCVPQGLLILLLLGLTLWATWRRPALGFVGAWFFLILAPTSSVVPIVTEIAAERRMYLPLASVVVLIVIGVYLVLQSVFRRPSLRFPVPQVASGVVVLATAAGLGLRTFERNRDYRTPLAMWADAVQKRPANYRAHNNLAGALIEAGRLAEAIAHCNLALQLRPDHARAHANLGLALKRQGDLEQAVEQYRMALNLKPDSYQIHHNLAIALADRGDIDEAIEHYTEALRIRPDSASAHYGLANAWLRRGDIDAAIEHYRATLRIDLGFAPAYYNLGNLLLEQGRIAEAIAHYTRAVQIRPDFADAHNNLGVALERDARFDEALKEYVEAVHLNPELITARVNLGVALDRQGKTEEAIRQYREALRIDPDYPQARKRLEAALAARRDRDSR